jgi:hypothetical protein
VLNSVVRDVGVHAGSGEDRLGMASAHGVRRFRAVCTRPNLLKRRAQTPLARSLSDNHGYYIK